MVFQKAISRLRNLASIKAKNASKKGDISTETQTARGEHEEMQFNVDAGRATEQQANSSKQRRSKKRTFPEFEEEIEPEDALNLMFDYFDKKFEGMQAQINKNMEPPAKKFKKPDGHDIKGKGNKDQFDFNTEISFAIQECQDQISRGNIEDLSANLTSFATKLKKRNKLIKLADRSPVGWSIVQEYEQDPMASDSDDAQKIRQAEQRAIRKRKAKTPSSFTQSSSSTISKAPSFQFRNISFQNGYSLPIPLQKQNLNTIQITPSTIPSTTHLTIPSDSPERPKVQTPAWVVESKAIGE